MKGPPIPEITITVSPRSGTEARVTISCTIPGRSSMRAIHVSMPLALPSSMADPARVIGSALSVELGRLVTAAVENVFAPEPTP